MAGRSNVVTRRWSQWNKGPALTGLARRSDNPEDTRWASINMHVLADGSVSPRPSFGGPLGVSYQGISNSGSNMFTFGEGIGGSTSYIVLVQEDYLAPSTTWTTRVLDVDSAQGGSFKSGGAAGISSGNTLGEPRIPHYGNVGYFSMGSFDPKGYIHYIPVGERCYIGGGDRTGTSGGITNICPSSIFTNSDSTLVAVHLDRLFLAGSPTVPQRIAYSDPADYETFTSASQYFDVGEGSTGHASAVHGMWSVGQSLIICMKDGAWYVLSGDPETGSLRKLADGPIPQTPAAAVVRGNNLFFLEVPVGNVVIVNAQGVDTTSLREVTLFESSPGEYSLTQLTDQPTQFNFTRGVYIPAFDWLMLGGWPSTTSGGSDVFLWLEYHKGVWTRHKILADGNFISDPSYELGTGDSGQTSVTPVDFGVLGGSTLALMAEAFELANKDLYVYVRPPVWEGPVQLRNITNDDCGLATGELHLAPIRPAAPGRRVRVRDIQIHGRIPWDDNANKSNDYVHTPNGENSNWSQTISVTSNGTALTTGDSYPVGDEADPLDTLVSVQYWNSADDFEEVAWVKITGIKFLVIDSIEVTYEEREEPRAP